MAKSPGGGNAAGMGMDVSGAPNSELLDGTEYLLFPHFIIWPSIANPLVYCGNIGLMTRSKIAKNQQAGQLIVVVGGLPEGMRRLEDGVTVTLHGDGFAVYEGVVPEASSAT